MFEIIKSGVDDVPHHVMFSCSNGNYWRAFLDFAKKENSAPGTACSGLEAIPGKQLDEATLRHLKASSPLGSILAAGIANSHHGRKVMKDCIEETGRKVAHDLERFLNALGTIAAVSPLLGLLGTVFGMIEIFSSLMT